MANGPCGGATFVRDLRINRISRVHRTEIRHLIIASEAWTRHSPWPGNHRHEATSAARTKAGARAGAFYAGAAHPSRRTEATMTGG